MATRLPIGTVLTKIYNEVTYTVTAIDRGFLVRSVAFTTNRRFPTLTEVARSITGDPSLGVPGTAPFNVWKFFGYKPNAGTTSAVKGKCQHQGCYEPADCKHGFCHRHCAHRHELLSYNSRRHPRSAKPHVGVELEVEYGDDNSFRRGLPLEGHRDGSLGSYGAEYKLLATSDKICAEAAELAEELWKRGARVSKRCGLHVHLDVRQLSASRVQELIGWLQRTQDTWFAMMPPSRRDNHFVQRISEGGSSSHYTWANKTSYGTVEIRLHGSTLNPHKLTGWLTALIHLQKKANDSAFAFPIAGTCDEQFWAVFGDCPAEGKEYLQTRSQYGGVISDRAYRAIEE